MASITGSFNLKWVDPNTYHILVTTYWSPAASIVTSNVDLVMFKNSHVSNVRP